MALAFFSASVPRRFQGNAPSQVSSRFTSTRHPKSGAAAPHYKTLSRLRARYFFPASHSLSGMA